MKKLIVICIVCACLLIPLKGYSSDWSVSRYLVIGGIAATIICGVSSATGGLGLIGILIGGIYSWFEDRHNAFVKVQDNEADLLKNAWDFRCSNTQLYQGQYQRYLSEIESFLTKCPRNKKFRNDMKTVFEMSQKDSRLTPKEKQEIVNEFTSKYKFILSEGQAK